MGGRAGRRSCVWPRNKTKVVRFIVMGHGSFFFSLACKIVSEYFVLGQIKKVK